MKFLWCDTETTGIDIQNSAPFQIAFIFVCSDVNGKIENEKTFYLNPFDIQGIEFNEDAAKIHGYSKETIESFEPSKEVVEDIDKYLSYCLRFNKPEKMFFCGYNNKFDLNHIDSLFKHHGKNRFKDFFYPQILDVFEQVKAAGRMKRLPYLENRKLTTVAKFLNINLEKAHDGMGDIQATREVAKSLTKMGVKLQ